MAASATGWCAWSVWLPTSSDWCAGRPQLVSCPYLDVGVVGSGVVALSARIVGKLSAGAMRGGGGGVMTQSAVTFAPMLRLEWNQG